MTIPQKHFIVTMGSALTLSPSVDLGRTWEEVTLEVPSMASKSDFFVHGSISGTTGTFRRITHPVPNTSSIQANDFDISSAVTARMVPIPSQFQYLQLEASTANVLAITFNIICRD